MKKAIATYTAETTPAAIRKAVRIANARAIGALITARDVRVSALNALRDAINEAITRG